jgi:tetratricopeptide (TPR) repeat protein
MKTVNPHLREVSRLVNEYFDQSDYRAAVELLQKEVAQHSEEHWLYAQLAISHYELREYETALKFSKKALELSPDCPLTLDYHASILLANGQAENSLSVWNQLLSRDLDDIAYGECGEGMRFAKSLVNDARFSVGDAYLEMKDREKALFYYKAHLENRQKGVFSNFTQNEVRREIRKLEGEVLA